jgi:hypothetical protein
MTTRFGLGAIGVLMGLFGLYQLLGLGPANLVATLVWLVGGVVLHDGVLALTTVAAVSLGAIVVPRRWKAAVAGAFLVLGTVTLSAVASLGRFGARPDNPTLLDRDYLAGWMVFAAAVCLGTCAVVLLGGRRSSRSRSGS